MESTVIAKAKFGNQKVKMTLSKYLISILLSERIQITHHRNT